MEKAQIDRISELTRLFRQRALTEEEQAERQALREGYLRAFRAQMRAQLDNVVMEYPDHSREALKDHRRSDS